MKKEIIKLNKIYFLDMSGSSPVELQTIEFTEKGVKCKYLSSWQGREEVIDYEFFRMNGYIKPDNFRDINPIKDINEMSEEELSKETGELWSYLYMIREVGTYDDFEWNGLDYWDADRRYHKMSQKLVGDRLIMAIKELENKE